MHDYRDITDAVTFFQRAFTIVLALALGEAFKQFVADKEEKTIHWDRLPALLTFLLMVFPFFHGMNRYFFLTYLNPLPVSKGYAGYLLFDSLVFMCESALFFIMSRSLAVKQWRRYFLAQLALLAVDTVWGFIELSKMPGIGYWIELNAFLAVALGLVLRYFWTKEDSSRPSIWAALATLTTTTISYYLLWNVYFPPLPPT